MSRKLTELSVMMVALVLTGANISAYAMPVRDVGADVRGGEAPIGELLAQFGRDFTTESSRAAWAAEVSGRTDFRPANPGEDQASSGPVQNTELGAGVDSLPQDDRPSGYKVPEPSTLWLLGGGLIAMANVARVKNPLRTGRNIWSLTVAKWLLYWPNS